MKEQEQYILDLLYSKSDRPFTIGSIIKELPGSYWKNDFTYSKHSQDKVKN